MPQRCTAQTARGSPCKAWAKSGTDPPRCVRHLEQPAPGHTSFYAASLKPDELSDLFTYADDLTLDDEIACARVVLRRLLALLDAPTITDPNGDSHPLAPPDLARLFGLSLQATRTIARLLRDKRALTGEAADGISGAIAQALDELSTEWGIEL